MSCGLQDNVEDVFPTNIIIVLQLTLQGSFKLCKHLSIRTWLSHVTNVIKNMYIHCVSKELEQMTWEGLQRSTLDQFLSLTVQNTSRL